MPRTTGPRQAVTEAQVAELAGVTLVRRCPEGEIGAFEVRLADGRPAVLKWYEDASVRPRLDWMLSAVAALRDAGYPAPRYEPVVEVPGALVVLQEWMPGAVSDEVSPEVVERVIELNAIQAGLTDSLNADMPYRHVSVQSSDQQPRGDWPAMLADGLTTPRPASPYVPETAQIAAALSSSGIAAPTDDAMHMDLHHRNVLQVDGRLRAVVDWETCRPGDRWYDLVVFALCLEVATAPAEPVWRLIDASVAPELVRAYTAYLALRLIDWSLDPNAPYEPEFWAAAARRRLG